jgi:hypothetical protein
MRLLKSTYLRLIIRDLVKLFEFQRVFPLEGWERYLQHNLRGFGRHWSWYMSRHYFDTWQNTRKRLVMVKLYLPKPEALVLLKLALPVQLEGQWSYILTATMLNKLTVLWKTQSVRCYQDDNKKARLDSVVCEFSVLICSNSKENS